MPADLEFLGCGGANVDNTTMRRHQSGSTEEYPGSGPITVRPSRMRAADDCGDHRETPPGSDASGNPLPAGVYTHVVGRCTT